MAHIKAFHEPYCKICNVRYKCHKNLRSHKRLYHQQESESALFCEECGKKCKNKNLLNQHRSFVHKRVENLNCNLCGKPCANMAKLRKHTKKCLTREDFESLYQSNIKKISVSEPLSTQKKDHSPNDFPEVKQTEEELDESEDIQKHNVEERETLLDYGALAFLSKDSFKDESAESPKDVNKDEDETKDELVEIKEEQEEG